MSIGKIRAALQYSLEVYKGLILKKEFTNNLEALTHLDKLEQYVSALEEEAYFAFHWFAIAESKNRDNNWMLHAGSEVLTAYKQARQKRLELRKEMEDDT